MKERWSDWILFVSLCVQAGGAVCQLPVKQTKTHCSVLTSPPLMTGGRSISPHLLSTDVEFNTVHFPNIYIVAALLLLYQFVNWPFRVKCKPDSYF